MEVLCEAANGTRVTRAKSYIILNDLRPDEREGVLCGWFSGKESAEWNDIEPNSFRMRLVGIAGRDSVFGPWAMVPAGAYRR
ncbi:MAG: hypothetical protein H0T48_13805 [Gemmatimonadaceae bacterium]|nr:hypothetical protein [Gemmatimonadaceae bacterium]